jgi:hypothetical protein
VINRWSGILFVFLALTGCSSDNNAVESTDANSCATDAMTQLGETSPVASTPLLGTGSVRPTGFSGGELGYARPAESNLFAGSEFGGAKVLWVVLDLSELPLEITGSSVDGVDPVMFNGVEGEPLQPSLKIDANLSQTTDGIQMVPSYVRLMSAGCYEFRVVTASSDYKLTFRAT